jgi:hypothetical protein
LFLKPLALWCHQAKEGVIDNSMQKYYFIFIYKNQIKAICFCERSQPLAQNHGYVPTKTTTKLYGGRLNLRPP